MTPRRIANSLRISYDEVILIIGKYNGHICKPKLKKKKPCKFCLFFPAACSGSGWEKGECILKHNGYTGQ